MNEQQNIQTVQEGYGFFAKGDITNLLNQHTEDTEFVFPGPADIIPYAGTYQGKDQVKEFFLRVSEALDFEQFEPREFFAQGDKVVVIGHTEGRIKPSGQPLRDDWVHVFTLREGKVSRLQAYMDTAVAVAGFSQLKAQAM